MRTIAGTQGPGNACVSDFQVLVVEAPLSAALSTLTRSRRQCAPFNFPSSTLITFDTNTNALGDLEASGDLEQAFVYALVSGMATSVWGLLALWLLLRTLSLTDCHPSHLLDAVDRGVPLALVSLAGLH